MSQVPFNQQVIFNAISQYFQSQADNERRKVIESKLGEFAKMPWAGYYCQCLAEVLLNQEMKSSPYAVPIQLLAATLWRQTVKISWNYYKKEEKEQLRKYAVTALQSDICRNRQILTQICLIIGTITQHDFPDEWKELLPGLLQMISSSMQQKNTIQLYSAVKCLYFVSCHLADQDISVSISSIAPMMFQIISLNELTIKIKRKALQVLGNVLQLIRMTSSEYENTSAQLLGRILGPLSNILISLLKYPSDQMSDPSLKIETIKLVMRLTQGFPVVIKNSNIQELLHAIFICVTKEYEIYKKVLIDEDADSTGYDSDGEVISNRILCCQIIELLISLIENPEYYGLFKNHLKTLNYYVISFMQMTEELRNTWQNDPNEYILLEDEEDNQLSHFHVRSSCRTFLNEMANSFEEEGCLSVINIMETMIKESQRLMTEQNSNWWKLREVALMAMISINKLISKTDQFNKYVEQMFQMIIQVDLRQDAPPPLQAMALNFIFRFLNYQTIQTAPECLKIMLPFLDQKFQLPVRISAARTISRMIQVKNLLPPDVLKNSIHAITLSLCNLLNLCDEETIHIILECLALSVSVDPDSILSESEKVANLLIHLFAKHFQDHLITIHITEIFSGMFTSHDVFQKTAPPLIPKILGYWNQQEIDPTMTSSLIELLAVIIRFAHKDEACKVMEATFLPLLKIMTENDDDEIVQTGTQCLRAFLHSCGDYVYQKKIMNNKTPLHWILEFVHKQLDPKVSESAGELVGPLITSLFVICGNILGSDVLIAIIQAAIGKLAASSNFTMLNNLLALFAKMIYENPALINLLFSASLSQAVIHLAKLPSNQNTSMHLLLHKWCSEQTSIAGQYQEKITYSAISKLLLSNDPRLNQVVIPYPLKTKRRRTRSQGPLPTRPTPFPIYAYIVLLRGYINAKNAKEESDELADDMLYGFESSGLLHGDGKLSDTDLRYLENLAEEEDLVDPYFKVDPINQIDILEKIPQILKLKQDLATHAAELLDEMEAMVLSGILKN